MKTVWQITLFTKMSVCREGQPPLKLRKRRSAELLAYLALHRGRENRREMLAAKIWPEDDPDVSRQNLRSALNLLREHLETSQSPEDDLAGKVVLADTVVASLNFECVTTDIAAYQALLRQVEPSDTNGKRIALLRQATALYGEGLLPEWYDEWVLNEQNRLRQEQQQALMRLSGLLRDRDENEEAILRARQALALDAHHEPAHECLMRAYLQAGQTTSMLQHYRRMEQMAGECDGDAPSPTLQALARQARTQAQMARRPDSASANLRPANLPTPPTQFFDRVDDLANLRGLLRSERKMITLTAIGGAGKTRLAMETARKLRMDFDGRVFWVELAALTNADGIAEAIAETVLRQRRADMPVWEQLAQEGGNAPALLVLDNFEHLAETGAIVVQELMRRLPTWRLLVTSRQALRIPGEQTYALPLLPPQAGVELFADRAQLVNPSFQLDTRNTPLVTALCKRLDGLPLAIELAAAWSDMLTPAEILQRLESRFDLLVSHYRSVPLRHRSLYAMIDWSHAQLPPALQQLFARLSVFRGGWSVEAAQAIEEARGQRAGVREEGTEEAILAGGNGQQERNFGSEAGVLFRLRELQARSLIVGAQTDAGTMRYSMLETLREFAHAQLSETERLHLDGCHATYFLNAAETANPHLNGPEAKTWLDALDRERENLNVALNWLCEQRQTQESSRLATALSPFWWTRGYASEGRQHFTRVLALSEEPTVLRARTLRYAGGLAYYQSDLAASTRLHIESLRAARKLQDQHNTAWALYHLGHTRLSQGKYRKAYRHLEICLRLCGTDVDMRLQAATLHKIGSVLLVQNAWEEARQYFERSAALFHDLGNRQAEATSLLNIGNVLVNQGNLDRARMLYQQALQMFESVGDVLTVAVAQLCLGGNALRRNNNDEARQLMEAALDTFRRLGSRVNEAWARYFLGTLAWRQNDSEQAREHYRDSLLLLRESGDQRRTALLVLAFGWLAQSENNPQRAARLFGAGNARFARLGTAISPAERYEYDPAFAAVRAILDEATFAACWTEGQAYTPEQAVFYALQEAAE